MTRPVGGSNPTHHEEHEEMSQPDIPVVDLEDLHSPRADRQARASEALNRGFGQFGLVFIKNHGIEAADLEAFYESFLEFTDRPLDAKQWRRTLQQRVSCSRRR